MCRVRAGAYRIAVLAHAVLAPAVLVPAVLAHAVLVHAVLVHLPRPRPGGWNPSFPNLLGALASIGIGFTRPVARLSPASEAPLGTLLVASTGWNRHTDQHRSHPPTAGTIWSTVFPAVSGSRSRPAVLLPAGGVVERRVDRSRRR